MNYWQPFPLTFWIQRLKFLKKVSISIPGSFRHSAWVPHHLPCKYQTAAAKWDLCSFEYFSCPWDSPAYLFIYIQQRWGGLKEDLHVLKRLGFVRAFNSEWKGRGEKNAKKYQRHNSKSNSTCRGHGRLQLLGNFLHETTVQEQPRKIHSEFASMWVWFTTILLSVLKAPELLTV